jgi:hypothetical protein
MVTVALLVLHLSGLAPAPPVVVYRHEHVTVEIDLAVRGRAPSAAVTVSW